MMIKFLSAIVMTQLFIVSLHAYNLRKINNKDNIPNSFITSIYQDNKGLIWMGTNNGLNIYNGKNVTPYIQANSKFIDGNRIDKIVETDENTLWIQTYKGLSCIDREAGTSSSFDMFDRIVFSATDSKNNFYLVQGNNSIYYFLKGQNKFEHIYIPNLNSNSILNFLIDDNDKIWMFKKNGSALCYSIVYDRKNNISLRQEKGYNHSSDILYCFSSKKNALIIDANYRLYEFNTNSQRSVHVADLNNKIGNGENIISVLKHRDDFLFGLEHKGLYILKKQQDKYVFEKTAINSTVTCLLNDKYQDLVWIGTDGQGVYTYSMEHHSIKSIVLKDYTLQIKQPVTALHLDRNNTLWIGSKGDGILKIFDYGFRKNIADCKTEYICVENSLLNGNIIHSFATSEHGVLWIGNEGGINYYSEKDRIIKQVPLLDKGMEIKQISDIYEQDSVLWIASEGMGIIKANIIWNLNSPTLKVEKRFTINDEDNISNFFCSIYPENDSILWFANRGEGAFKVNTITFETETIRFDKSGLNSVNTISKDKQNNYLIGTNSGLVIYNSDTKHVLNKESGFPSNAIYSISQESNIDYWFSSNRGIIYYNSNSESFKEFNDMDGLSVIEFSPTASYHDKKTGTLFLGGTNGFVTINKNSYDESQDYMPPILFDQLSVLGKDYDILEFLSEEKNMSVLTLKHDQNIFSIAYSAIDHLNANHYSYYYKLDGRGNKWIKNGNSNTISFTDVKPGEYKLDVKYYNKILNKESYTYTIKINVLPPWYQSTWAYLAYFLLAGVATILVTRLLINRNKQRRADILGRLEQQHKVEVYESKLQFFTNIAHEFCTPLTLIYGPCDRILHHKNVDSSIVRYTQVIQHNAERLNSLILDLIEFKRIEAGYQNPEIVKLDISTVTLRIIDSFADIIESENIKFEKDISPALNWNCDRKFYTTIITNLISNAIKYSANEKKVKVKVRLMDDCLCLTVSNIGKGIKPEDIPNLFDRYNILRNFEYQDNSASWSRNGLGLAISYNMVNLLNGTINIDSVLNEWTHFEVRLPYLETINTEKTASGSIFTESNKSKVNSRIELPQYNFDETKSTILVIDDEIEILWFICDIFANEFNVVSISVPEQVSDVLEHTQPDIIICDIVMPCIDGITLTKSLKSNEKTAHIPLVILSGKHEIEEQVKAINEGAEMYITKPFDVDYLKSSVKQLIKRKETLKDYYASPLSAFDITNGKLIHKEQKKFIKDILSIINKNIRNKELSANFIATRMNMSSRSLYRKVYEIDDMSITDMITDCRLHTAKELLVKSKSTVDEIVMKSGFTNRASFYRMFAKKYNCTPTEFRKLNNI